MLTRIFLALQALLLTAFGIYAFLNPIGMASGLGVEIGGPNGAYEMRGIYGGVSLAAGLLCGTGTVLPGLRKPALWFLVTYMGGYVFARAGALVLGPAPTPDFVVFIAFETISLVLSALALRASDRA